MSETVKQSPLGVNSLSSLLQGIGFHKNPIAVGFVGESFGYEPSAGYAGGGAYALGSLCDSTVLRMITYSINSAYLGATALGTVSNTVYNNIINIGSGTIPAFGNSKPPTFDWDQPSGYYGVGNFWAPTGWGGPDQYTRTVPTNPPNPVTAWGFVRLLSLQAWNEFNYNNTLPEYRDFVTSFMTASGFIDQTNVGILAADNGKTYLDGVYSNMNDLATADIAGISLSTVIFGQDLIKLGNAIDLSSLPTFGLPSNLLLSLKNNNALTDAVVLALLSSGITTFDLQNIIDNPGSATQDHEKNMYAAYTVITGDDLSDVLIPLNCKTAGLTTLADLLNPKKLFPSSYETLTVPIYNGTPGPTNSKTYYHIYSGGGTNTQINSPAVAAKIGDAVFVGAPKIATPQIETMNVNDAVTQLQNGSNTLTSQNNIAMVAPFNPITSNAQSITTTVVDSIPQVVNSPLASSIASGETSSAFRPGKPFYNTEEK
jgi:hypothetical protein